MTPRRLLPFLLVFVILASLYFALEWHRERQSRQEEEAKKIFAVKEADISAVTLKRPSDEVHLAKEGQKWHLTQPLKDQVDAVAMNSLLNTLAHLRLTRDLGLEKDLKPFGLDRPALVLSFKAGDKSHTLSVGNKAPGGQGYYARRGQDPRVLIIDASSKETLDRPLADLRNRALFDFTLDKVTALRVKTPAGIVALEKTGDKWQWLGREQVKIFADRLERLLRFISLARVKEFVSDAPQDLKKYGLDPPALEITLATDQGEQSLLVGIRHKDLCYAHKGERTPVVLVENLILDLLTSPLEKVPGLEKNPLWSQVRGTFPYYLEDRRLWTGEVKEVAGLTWGPPDKPWTATKEQDFFKLSGPGQQELRQPALRVELALLKLRDLEGERLATPAKPGAPVKNRVELRNAAGQPLFGLEELGLANQQIRVRFIAEGAPPQEALVPESAYSQWQKEMAQLTLPPATK
ncbi:MAG: DUF4340 domain-containing protein [Desulfobaccales bacterium]